MSDGTAGSGFAELLRELKDRSGLSYGTLAKRLHMSTSTLHRYCNGDAVPADYAPVERLARLCKARPEELVELHRRWVLADAGRRRKTDASEKAAKPTGAAKPAEATEAAEAAGAVAGAVAAEPPEPPEPPEQLGPSERAAGAVVEEPGGEPAAAPRRRRVPRRALLAGIAVVVLLGASALAVRLSSGGTDDRNAGAATQATGAPHTSAVPPPGTPSSSSQSSSATDAAPPPFTVNTQPYTWESPCSQRYLIDRAPAAVAPPPVESDATAWVSAHQAVSAGEQYVTLTLKGTGSEPVVLESLAVRTVERGSPLAWNDYAMGTPGVGCGENVPARFFTVALDGARPALVPAAGHRNFPFKVSDSDPEVIHVRADASAYSVGWYLELSWSSGARSGTLRIDDKGRPFRTSGDNGRPVYEFPLGGEAWRTASSAG
ncbi:helix-turn-helix domain-containing protein [Streptomyces sasae]|uniref:helix-turn-helix domain-containing protein n=1 Tax=Streptomyces sasae TaxID=1266772 RepID=UPI00292CCD1E|nr:helix-turn-helix transcriptional regulator [Streptomyces sasae]